MKILVACEYSGRAREAFRKLGHMAWSCDLRPSEDNSPYHHVGDVTEIIDADWDLLIAHPPCTRLTNAGVRWLHVPPKGKTLKQMWDELEEGVMFYKKLRDSKIKKKAIENPVMNPYAKAMLGLGKRHIVQPWWFGEPAFKATGFELVGLLPLVATNKLTPPKRGTEEHKKWSWVHRMPPGPNREKERSRTFQGIADAMAAQWGGAL